MPVIAYSRIALDDKSVDAELLQAGGNGQPALAGADHDHCRVAAG
jgi:hypothetical protein